MMAESQSNKLANDTSELRIVLKGGSAELGQVPAADVARLIEGSIRSIARAAELLSGRSPRKVGRRGSAVETATRFVLDGIVAGSVAVLLRLPPIARDDGDGLSLDDESLSDLAIAKTLDSLAGVDLDAYLAAGLADLGEELGLGTRYQDVRFEFTQRDRTTRSVALDMRSTRRLRRTASSAPQASANAVMGTLVEADFERLTARLRTPSDRQVKVTFAAAQADEIQHALRQITELEGVVTYDSKSNEAISIETRSIIRTDQVALKLDDGDYWRNPSVAELAEEQGVAAHRDPSGLHDDDASESELDAFFEALSL